MQINNIKIDFSSAEYSDEKTFNLEISEEIIEAIKARRQAFARFREGFPDGNDQLCFTPSKGITSELGTVISINIMATPFENDDEREGFMLELSDADGYTYESEWLTFEALEKTRFLLQDNGDDIYEWEAGLDDGVFDPEDFQAIYADNLEEAKEMFREAIGEG